MKRRRKRTSKAKEDDKLLIKIGPVGFTVVHGAYGAIWFLVFVCAFLLSTKLHHWPILGISAVLAAIFAKLTHNPGRTFFYRVLRNRISLVDTLENELKTKLPGEIKEIKEAVRILEESFDYPIFIPSFLREKVREIADILADAFHLENNGWYRVLNINYLNFTFRKTNIWHYLSSNIKSTPLDLLSDTLRNIVEFQKKRPSALHISIRDIYAGVLDIYREKDARAVNNYYEDLADEHKVSLIDHLRDPDREEYNKWKEGIHEKRHFNLNYQILEEITVLDTKKLLKIYESMKKHSRSIVTQIVTSETHVVLSAYYELENGRPSMIISATNTNKNDLLVFSQTPLVWKEADDWQYLCDNSYYPSSETLTHWKIHSELKNNNKPEYPFVVHCHSVDVLDYVTIDVGNLRNIESSLGVVTSLSWMKHGSEAFGRHISGPMIENGLCATVIEDHGIWVAGESFKDATKLMVGIVDFTYER